MVFLVIGASTVLSLAAFGGAQFVVRVLAVAVVLLVAGGVRVLGFDRTSPREQHRSWVLLELGFVILAAGSLLGDRGRIGHPNRAGGGGSSQRSPVCSSLEWALRSA